jgi:hypothetical protein
MAVAAGNPARSTEKVVSVAATTVEIALCGHDAPVERVGIRIEPTLWMATGAIVARVAGDSTPPSTIVVTVTGRAHRGPFQLHLRAVKRLGQPHPSRGMTARTIVTVIAPRHHEISPQVLAMAARTKGGALQGNPSPVPVRLRCIAPFRGVRTNGLIRKGRRFRAGPGPQGQAQQNHQTGSTAVETPRAHPVRNESGRPRGNLCQESRSHGHLPWQRAHVGAALPVS